MENNETMKVDNLESERAREVKSIINIVYNALTVKGYNPVSQMVGYILSGDPTYITNYDNARSVISRVERDEILEEFVKSYIKGLALETVIYTVPFRQGSVTGQKPVKGTGTVLAGNHSPVMNIREPAAAYKVIAGDINYK